MKGKRQNFRSYDLAQRFFGPNPDWRRVEWAQRSRRISSHLTMLGCLGVCIDSLLISFIDPTRAADILLRSSWVYTAVLIAFSTKVSLPKNGQLWSVWIAWSIFSFFFLRQFFRPNPDFLFAMRTAILAFGAISIPWIGVVLVWLRKVWRIGPDENYNLERTPPNELSALLERLQTSGAEILGLEVIWRSKPSEPASIHGFVCHRWTAVKEVKEELLAYSRELSDTLSSQDFEYEMLWREPANEALKTNSAKPVL